MSEQYECGIDDLPNDVRVRAIKWRQMMGVLHQMDIYEHYENSSWGWIKIPAEDLKSARQTLSMHSHRAGGYRVQTRVERLPGGMIRFWFRKIRNAKQKDNR